MRQAQRLIAVVVVGAVAVGFAGVARADDPFAITVSPVPPTIDGVRLPGYSLTMSPTGGVQFGSSSSPSAPPASSPPPSSPPASSPPPSSPPPSASTASSNSPPASTSAASAPATSSSASAP